MGKHNDDHLEGFLYHTRVRIPTSFWQTKRRCNTVDEGPTGADTGWYSIYQG